MRQLDILKLTPLDETDKEIRMQMYRVINQAAQTVLNMKARTDEGRFRRQAFDKLPEILRLIADEDRKRALPVLELTALPMESS